MLTVTVQTHTQTNMQIHHWNYTQTRLQVIGHKKEKSADKKHKPELKTHVNIRHVTHTRAAPHSHHTRINATAWSGWFAVLLMRSCMRIFLFKCIFRNFACVNDEFYLPCSPTTDTNTHRSITVKLLHSHSDLCAALPSCKRAAFEKTNKQSINGSVHLTAIQEFSKCPSVVLC